MKTQCKCELPYVLSGTNSCTKCGNQNTTFVRKIADGTPYDTSKERTNDKYFVGDIFSVFQKPFGCYVKIVEVHNDGWGKVQVPSGGYMDTQILGELIRCAKCTDKNGQNIGNMYMCERCGRSVG